MSNVLEKIEFTEEDILDVLSSRMEESINIEFKSSDALSNVPSVKKEISKDISAFANSDGGIIFYGINEESHVATSLSFVDGNVFTKEWLENVITSTIQQRIEDLKIIPVRFNNEITKTIYVIKVPKSLNMPHINADKKYYRRYNFQSVAMEEYEVRDSYLRYRESKVTLHNVLIYLENFNGDIYDFKIEVHVANLGNFMAEKYRISCLLNNTSKFVNDFGTVRIISAKNTVIGTNRLEDGYKISTKEVVPLFPNEALNVLTFNIEIPKKYFSTFINESQIDFHIFSVGAFEIESKPEIFAIMKKKVDESNDICS